MNYEIHPRALLWPPFSAEDLRAHTDDIRRHGLRDPITLDMQKRVIDGRHH